MKNADKPAYPVPLDGPAVMWDNEREGSTFEADGVTKLEYFTAVALRSLIIRNDKSCSPLHCMEGRQQISELAVLIAKAQLEELDKVKK